MDEHERAGTRPEHALESKKPEAPGEGGPAIHGQDLDDDAAATPGTPPDGQIAKASGQDDAGAAPNAGR